MVKDFELQKVIFEVNFLRKKVLFLLRSLYIMDSMQLNDEQLKQKRDMMNKLEALLKCKENCSSIPESVHEYVSENLNLLMLHNKQASMCLN